MANECVFCEIANYREPGKIIFRWEDAMAIIPLNPAITGHILVIPKAHVKDASVNPSLSSELFYKAIDLAKMLDYKEFNIITSVGRSATQTVFHLHIHIVPRYNGDGLKIPWGSANYDNDSDDLDDLSMWHFLD